MLERVLARGEVELDYEVIPGISSVHALTARHRIPLNRVGGAVQITTGRRLARDGWPDGVDDLVVMLDADCSFGAIDPAGVEIYWGAYLGTPDELLVAGPLAEVADEIRRVRAEARERKGWIMDTYVLRRSRAVASRGGCRGSPPRRAPGRRRSSAVRRTPAACDVVGDVAERAAEHDLVGPARAGDDGGRAVRAVVRQSVATISSIACAPRWMTSVAPWAASPPSSSPAGIADARRP